MPAWLQKKPQFAYRGLMLDISRNRVPTQACLRRLVDALAALHYNQLQLYTEHTFAYQDHATVWEKASPMTASEIRQLDGYCAARGIELVPNQNSFGHMEHWLRHPAYQHLAECPDGFEHPISGWRQFGSTLYPDAASARFMAELYAELLPNFQSRQLHVGGDEPWELGQGRSAERVTREGKHSVYLDFMQQIFAAAAQHGCKPQFWADIILERPDLVPQLPPEVIPVIWGYEADSPFPEQCRCVADAGFRDQFYVAPGAGNWNSFSGRLDVARANIQLAAREGAAHGASGLLLTAWGDNGHHQAWATLYPPLILAAAAAHGQNIDDTTLAESIDTLFFPEQAPGNGHALCQLGRIDACLPQPSPPTSFLHSALFADEAGRQALCQTTTPSALEACRQALDAIDTGPLDAELQLAAGLNRAALESCLNQPPTIPPAQLQASFTRQWLHHSRPGGLAESLSRFTAQ
ncbi:MAG: beta-N-acetylhexosaminidase [Puniceicoccaceae bacterium]|nr:MAG: beta-N-acetylhexosaminidase [Puniceicoccaceae bacterium]